MRRFLSIWMGVLAVTSAVPIVVPFAPRDGSPAELEALARRDIDRYQHMIALTSAQPE